MKTIWDSFCSITFSVKTIFTAFVLYVLVVFSGPFGTFDQLPLLGRVVFWGPLIALALCASGGSCMIALHGFPQRVNLQHAFIAAGLFVLIYTPLLFLMTASGILGHMPQAVPMPHLFGSIVALACVLGVWSLVFGPSQTVLHRRPDVLPRLYGRLPEVGEHRVARITVQDHYVEVHMSDKRSHRLLMRFADAVNEMDQAVGFCTHRSHWVARDAVRAAVKDGAKEVVIMASGERIPVSKTYRDNLVSAGFL